MKPLCYVGEWGPEFLDDKCVPFTALIHPREFQKYVDTLLGSIWTNNAYLVDCFKAEQVMVCHQGKVKCLTEHSEWNRCSDAFSPGEFWSMIGEAWVSK